MEWGCVASLILESPNALMCSEIFASNCPDQLSTFPGMYCDLVALVEYWESGELGSNAGMILITSQLFKASVAFWLKWDKDSTE